MPAGRHEDRMVDVFAEWVENAPVDRCGIPDPDLDGCSELFRVRWHESFVAEGGRRLICHYSAPDAESVRIALRRASIAVESVWSGTVHRLAATHSRDLPDTANLSSLPAGTRRALAMARAAWVVPGELELTRAIVSSDRRRVIGVCDTTQPFASPLPCPGDEVSPSHVWRCRRLAAGSDGSASPTQSRLSVLLWSGADVTPDTRPRRPPAAP